MADDLAPAAEPEAPDSFGSEPTVAEKGEAALDEAIEKLMGPPTEEDEEYVAPRVPGQKKAAKKDEDDPDELEDADDGDQAELEDDDTEDGESDEDEDDDMALHRAYTRLHEKGIPAKVLKRTPKDELIAWADRVGSEQAGAKDTPSKTERTRETPDGAKADKGDKPAAPTWADIRRGLAEKFGIDEEAADAVKPLYDTNEALTARLAAIESKFDEMRQEAVREKGQNTIDKEMRRLRDHYPNLVRNNEKRDAIIEEASTMAAGLKARGEQVDARKVFEKAARVVMGDPKRADLAAKRRNGVSHPPETLGNSRSAPLDETSYWERGVDLAVSGKGADAIKRLVPPLMKPKRRL